VEAMTEPIPLEVPSLIVDGSSFETVTYPDDQIMLRVTNGDIQVVEYSSTDRGGPPPHRHPWHEVEFVIEGEVEFMVDGGPWTRGGPGTVQMLQAGASHSVRIPDGQARLLMVTVGAPYDGFAKAVAGLLQRDGYTAADLVDTAGRFGVTLG
jgi:quercetin dioxygenase-like cupin family protein